jgi:hypothetical protein
MKMSLLHKEDRKDLFIYYIYSGFKINKYTFFLYTFFTYSIFFIIKITADFSLSLSISYPFVF